MARAPCSEKSALKKGAWSPEEDQKLIAYIKRYGIWNWSQMAKPAGLARSGKSCRLRWVNYLRPSLKHGNFTEEEQEIILKLHDLLGNRWSAIAAKLPGRTDNEIKNYWHTHLKKGLIMDPKVKPEAATISNYEATQINFQETNILVVPNESTVDGESRDRVIPLAAAAHLSTGDYSSSSTDAATENNENQTIEEGYNPYWMEDLYIVEDSWETFSDHPFFHLWFPADPIYQCDSYDGKGAEFWAIFN